MKKISIFCFGFGQVAKNFIEKIDAENIKINLSTTSRKKTHQKKIKKINYTSFKFHDEDFDPDLIKNLEEADYILISIPPKNGTDKVIENFSKIIENCNPKWITYLSATSVYGNHKGKWVNEQSKTIPTSDNGISRLAAEKSWTNLCTNKKLPFQIFRLSGIYSFQNNVLARLQSGTASIINSENNFFSRIHVEDIANILFESLSNFKSGEIFNISDDKPSSAKEVILYGVKILNVKKPKSIEIENIESNMLKNFYKDSKKVSNKKMKNFFKYNLKFPTYIEGLNFIKNNFI